MLSCSNDYVIYVIYDDISVKYQNLFCNKSYFHYLCNHRYSTNTFVKPISMSTIKRTGGNVSVSLSVFVYKDLNYPDGDMYIAYCPELDLAGYDTTNRKARKSFEYVLKDYLDHTIQNGTLEEDLIGHGWRKYKNGRIAEPTYSELLKRSQLKSILKQRTFNKYSIPVLV